MSGPNNHSRHITYAAWQLSDAQLWLDALAEEGPVAAIPALCDLLVSSAEEVVRVRTAQLLARRFADHESVRYAMREQLLCPSSPVRASVARHAPRESFPAARWRWVLERDPAPLVRRAALRALAGLGQWTDIVQVGLSDPVWRVRRDAAETVIRGQLPAGALAGEIDHLLARADTGRYARRAVAFIRRCIADDISPPPEPERPGYTQLPWWSDDPAVMLATLKHVSADDMAESLPGLIQLAEWQDGYPLTNCMREMRALIGRAVAARGTLAEWQLVAGYLDRPRIPYAAEWAKDLLDACPRADDLARALVLDGGGRESLVWAIARYPLDRDARATSPALLQCARAPHAEVRAAALDRLRGVIDARRHSGANAQGVLPGLTPAELDEALAAGLADPEPEVCRAAVGLAYARAAAALGDARAWSALLERRSARADSVFILGCLQHLPDSWLRAQADNPELAALAGAGIDARLALARRAAGAQMWPICDRLSSDSDHRVRAAALTPTRATALCATPELEPSWRVLDRAAALSGVPLTSLAPPELRDWPASATNRKPAPDRASIDDAADVPDDAGSWHTGSYFQSLEVRPMRATPEVTLPASLDDAEPVARWPLRSGRMIAPLILSGRHSLSEVGFAHALEAGVNCLFWEPEYHAQTRFIRGLRPAVRHQLAYVGGTFAHEPDEVAADIDAMLHVLDIECIDLFFLFWVRDRVRLSDDVARTLLDAQSAGKIANFGLSTHDRGLAVYALECGWNTLMVRHSAVHPGIEHEVLPIARDLGAQILTFSNLKYTLMLRPRAGLAPPYEAADCYRYSLSQPGVTACISAPRTVREVRHNLAVLRQPTLDGAFQERMREYAARVRLESRRMMRLIRAD